MSLPHGGNLRDMARQHNSKPEEWIDLSTGISPFGYPIPEIPADIFRELPQASEQLTATIKNYLACENFVLANGTQAIIQTLPELPIIKRVKRTIWVPQVGYKEHQKAWQSSEQTVEAYLELPPLDQLTENTILIIINPNNPNGEFYQSRLLQSYADRLTQVNGWLVVDEAFTEATEVNHSLLPFIRDSNTIVLRSIGKFFGLAGIRAGLSTSTSKAFINELEAALGPWHVSGPTQFIVESALGNQQWQSEQRKKHALQSERLDSVLLKCFSSKSITGCQLFKTIYHSAAEEIHKLLCAKRVYVRLCDEKNAIRIGLPNNEQLAKLEVILKQLEIENNGLRLNEA